MVTPEFYRAKAAEYAELARTAHDPGEAGEFQRRQRSFAVLADNEQWLAAHRDQTVPAAGAADETAPVTIGDAAAAVEQ